MRSVQTVASVWPTEKKQVSIRVIDESIAEILSQGVEAAIEYLALPLVVDGFKNHHERRQWRVALPRAEQLAVKHNQLSGTAINGVIGKLLLLQMSARSLGDQHSLNRALGIIDQKIISAFADYSGQTIGQQLMTVGRLVAMLEQLLNMMQLLEILQIEFTPIEQVA